MPTATVDHAADRREALAANERLEAKRAAIVAREREVLERTPVGSEESMSAEDVETLERTDAEFTRLSKVMDHNAKLIERADAALADAEALADAPPVVEELAAHTPTGDAPRQSDGQSLADIERAMVAQGVRKGRDLLAFDLPPMRFKGRPAAPVEFASGERFNAVANARPAGFGPNADIDLSDQGVAGVERLAISTGTSGLEFPEATMEIIDAMWDVSRIWDWIRVISTPTGNKIKPSVRTRLAGAAGPTSPWGAPNYEAEGADIRDDADPTYVGRELNSFRIADIHYESYEVLRDHVPGDIRSNVAAATLKWLGLSTAHEVAVGSGANAPAGLVTELVKAANNSRRFTVPKATAAGDGVVAGDRGPRISDIQNAIHQIPDEYVSGSMRSTVAFFTSWKNGAHFRRLRIDDGARFYMDRDPSGRTLGSVDGIPVVCSPGFPDLARDAKGAVVFGCMEMALGRTLETRLEYSWEERFKQDQLAVKGVTYFDFTVLDPAAFYAFDCQDAA